MQFGLSLPPFGEHADPRLVRSLAVDAEAAGWDGFFLWDHMVFRKAPLAVADPWIALAAVAGATERIRIGTMVAPPRRRPWVVARQAVGLDRLSDGRFVLGVGLGAPVHQDFGSFGEATNDRERAAMLDESLALLERFTSGQKPACGNALSGQGRDVPAPAGAVTDPDLGGRLLAGSGPDAKGSALSGRRAGTQRGPLRPSDLSQIRELIDHHRGSQGSSTTSSPVPPRGRGRRATRRSSRPGSRPAPPGGSRTSACGDSAEAGPTRPGRRTRSPAACVAAHRSPDAAHGRPAVSRRDPARPAGFRRLG